MNGVEGDDLVVPSRFGDDTVRSCRSSRWTLPASARSTGTWCPRGWRGTHRLIAMFGYDVNSFDESIAAFNARLHPAGLARVTADLQHAVESVRVFDSEYRLVLPSGGIRWIGAHGRALADQHGRATRLLGAAYDITVRRTVGVSATSLLQSMATAFFAFDPEWRFTFVNDEATVVLDRTREELVGGVI